MAELDVRLLNKDVQNPSERRVLLALRLVSTGIVDTCF
jgi:hypothetical protein